MDGNDTTEVNQPLDPAFVERFETKLVREHPYLLERKLTPAVVETFGLGVFPVEQKGMMRGRLVIPIHDEEGRLLAYAGRWLGSDEDLPEGAGKYLLPKGFNKAAVLYSLNRVRGRKHLVVVEGFFSVMRLFALGVPAVALMGRALSDEQIALLHKAGVRFLTVLLDGDEPDRSAAAAMMARLSREPFRVKFALLPEGTEPDTVEETVLRELLRLPS
jgi:DNA primase